MEIAQKEKSIILLKTRLGEVEKRMSFNQFYASIVRLTLIWTLRLRKECKNAKTREVKESSNKFKTRTGEKKLSTNHSAITSELGGRRKDYWFTL